MTATPIAQRRATAARMSRNGASLRRIAAQLGVSKDTVRRDLAQDSTPANATTPATPATDATQVRVILPGAHPCAVEAAAALRDIDPDTLRDDARQLRDTRLYLFATMRRATELLAHTGPLDPLDRLSVRHLADQLRAIADAD